MPTVATSTIAANASQGGRPRKPIRRRASKSIIMSPEARRAIRERELAMVEEFLARNAPTVCPDRWANGAVPDRLFGTDG